METTTSENSSAITTEPTKELVRILNSIVGTRKIVMAAKSGHNIIARYLSAILVWPLFLKWPKIRGLPIGGYSWRRGVRYTVYS